MASLIGHGMIARSRGAIPSDGSSVRNAYRLVDKLNLIDMPLQPLGPFTLHDEIVTLRNLRCCCQRLMARSVCAAKEKHNDDTDVKVHGCGAMSESALQKYLNSNKHSGIGDAVKATGLSKNRIERPKLEYPNANPLPPRLAVGAGRRQADIPEGPRPRGHQPGLPDEDFAEAVRIAQAEFDKHQPDVGRRIIAGRGRRHEHQQRRRPPRAALPGLEEVGNGKDGQSPDTVILHSRADDVVPFADSEELARTSGATLIEVGTDHRLADPEPLAAMLRACEGAE